MSALQFLTAITSVLAVLILLVLLRLPATKAMPISLLATAVSAWGIWQMAPVRIAAAIIEGWFVALSMLYYCLAAGMLVTTWLAFLT